MCVHRRAHRGSAPRAKPPSATNLSAVPMTYTFSLHRRTGIALASGLALCFGLVFVAGWVAGVNSQVAQLVADTTGAPAKREVLDSQPRSSPLAPDSTWVGGTAAPGSGAVAKQPQGEAKPQRQGGQTEKQGGVSAPDSRHEAGEALPNSGDASAHWAIQIGGYTDRAGARRVAARVEADGRPVRLRVEEREADTLYRVWVGRYATRAAASQRVDAVADYTGNAFVTRVRNAK